MNKPKKPAAAPAKQAKSGISVGLLVLVLAAAAALVAVLVARRGGGIVAQDSGIVFVDRLPSGAYPNVTGRVQILDYGVTSPRPIDGPIPFRIAGKVAVEDWSGRKDNIAETCIKSQRPFILRNTVVSRWPALAKWTPEYFRTSVPSWRNVSRARRLKRCFINYEPNTPFERVTPWDFWENRESREEHPMSIAEWFEHASHPDDGTQWFLADQLPEELHGDVSPRHQLKLRDQTWVYFGVWMGEGGATTAAHWDMDSNLYAQFYGRKRFLLFSPSDYKLWKSYPRASPNHKQVQMEQDNPSRYSYRLAPGSPRLPVAYEAILQPGDLLYIPAYWYHHVEAMLSAPGTSQGGATTSTEHLSISSNFWSTASMDFLLAIGTPLPFGKDSTAAGNAALRAAFPADYPSRLVPMASRMALLALIADGTFPVRGGLASVARQACFLRYVDLFGPPEQTTADCAPPLDDSTQMVLAQLLAPTAQPFIRGLKSINAAAAETEFLNMVEMHLTDVAPVQRLYAILHNCYSHTLVLDHPPIAKVFPN